MYDIIRREKKLCNFKLPTEKNQILDIQFFDSIIPNLYQTFVL